MKNKFLAHKLLYANMPLSAKAFTIFLSLILFSCSAKAPFLSSIDPKIGRMGEVITLRGSNFGSSREESFVSIAGTTPTSSSYFSWNDDFISVRVPESGESGLVYVHVKGKRSNGMLFSNSAAVPRPVEGEDMGLEPKIASVSPQTGAPGALIVITGNNFEGSRGDGGVFISWDYESPSNPFAVREPEFIEVSETELGYEYWSAREVRVRLPDGAVSGNLEVRTHNGRSRPVFFDVSGKPGYKNFTDKRSYTVSYSVDVKVKDASRPNTLYLWMPQPVVSPSQRNVKLISRSAAPYVENHRGVSLFKLENLVAGSSHSINVSFNIEVYAQETGMRHLSIKQEKTPLLAAYTQSTKLLPVDNAKVKSIAASVAGNEQNPYFKARLIYDWIIKNVRIKESSPASVKDGVIAVLDKKEADSYGAALLFTTMARAAGLPCIPVAGVIINRGGNTLRHYWAEIWIDSFGWLPVDPVMGAGAVPDTYITKQDLANYYFGNLDSQRIAFSRGELNLSQMDRRGRPVSHTQSYSLQNIWEEAAGGLESYTSLWGDITISGIYVQ